MLGSGTVWLWAKHPQGIWVSGSVWRYFWFIFWFWCDFFGLLKYDSVGAVDQITGHLVVILPTEFKRISPTAGISVFASRVKKHSHFAFNECFEYLVSQNEFRTKSHNGLGCWCERETCRSALVVTEGLYRGIWSPAIREILQKSVSLDLAAVFQDYHKDWPITSSQWFKEIGTFDEYIRPLVIRNGRWNIRTEEVTIGEDSNHYLNRADQTNQRPKDTASITLIRKVKDASHRERDTYPCDYLVKGFEKEVNHLHIPLHALLVFAFLFVLLGFGCAALVSVILFEQVIRGYRREARPLHRDSKHDR
jgi:hypothetical protein